MVQIGYFGLVRSTLEEAYLAFEKLGRGNEGCMEDAMKFPNFIEGAPSGEQIQIYLDIFRS